MVEEIIPLKNIPKFKDKLWCKLYIENKLKDFIQNYYIDCNNTWEDTMKVLQITHRRLSKCIKYYNLYKPKNKVKERVHQSIFEKYGSNSYFENGEFKEKRKETMLNKYGVEYTFQSKELTNKVYRTTKLRHGYENPFFSKKWQLESGGSKQSWSKEARNTRIQNSIERYNTKFPTQRYYNSKSAEILNDKQKFIDFVKEIPENERTIINISNKLNISYDVVSYHYKDYELWNIIPLRQFRSFPEIEITNFIKSIYDKTIIVNTRDIIPPYELDIYLPDIQFAIEFNGVFWHNKEISTKEKYKEQKCDDIGICLIQVWEDDWILDRNLELNRIKNCIEGRIG